MNERSKHGNGDSTMSGGGAELAIRYSARPSALMKPIDLSAIPAMLVTRPPPPPAAQRRRTKLWEFGGSLHCSIIGTCLSTQELRHVLRRLKLADDHASDHDLHRLAVSLAGRHDEAARQLNKALDQRHKLAVAQFAKATDEPALRTQWSEAVKRGDIPGAYWAALTHPAATQAIIRDAFGEVHMLSHLVGSANRADLKRLCQLEAEKAELEARLARQQAAFHAAVSERDSQIAALRQSLAAQIIDEARPATADSADEGAALRGLVIDMEKRLAAEKRRREAAEQRQAASVAELAAERTAHAEAERTNAAFGRELAAAEAALRPSLAAEAVWLDGEVVLYVGGRPNQTAHLRAAANAVGADLLHHDGGIESHQSLLPGLVSRSGLVVFPVDCISHDAALNLKALCRQAGKRYMPLRTASVTALLAALQTVASPRPQAAAE
jgi:Uncharacterized protein conserved in bacteria (DUF2325)